jgi:hypothetical protein
MDSKMRSLKAQKLQDAKSQEGDTFNMQSNLRNLKKNKTDQGVMVSRSNREEGKEGNLLGTS